METTIDTEDNPTTDRLFDVHDNDQFKCFIASLDLSQKSIDTYRRSIQRFFRYLEGKNIEKPTRSDILTYKNELSSAGIKATSIQTYLISLKQYFKWLNLEQLYPDVSENIKVPAVSKDHKRDYLTTNQVRMVLDGINTETQQGLRDYAMILLLFTGGLRTIEASRANIEDIRTTGDSTVLYILGKGRNDRSEYVKLTYPVEKALRKYLATRNSAHDNDPLFVSTSNNSNGERLSTRSISKIIKQAFLSVGLTSNRLTAHSTRHTAVTLALLGGMSLDEVQQFARHKSINTTMIYNHAIERSKNRCAETITNAIFESCKNNE